MLSMKGSSLLLESSITRHAVCGFDQAPRIRWSGSAGRFSVTFVDLHSPTRAVHGEQHAVLNRVRPNLRAHDARDAVFACHDGTVTQDTTRIAHHAAVRHDRGCGE